MPHTRLRPTAAGGILEPPRLKRRCQAADHDRGYRKKSMVFTFVALLRSDGDEAALEDARANLDALLLCLEMRALVMLNESAG